MCRSSLGSSSRSRSATPTIGSSPGVDGGYPEHGVLLEFDGMVTYSALLRPGQSASEVVVAEKRREERISALGWLVIRVVWADLQHPSVLIRRIQLACQDRQRLTGMIRGTARIPQ